MKAAVLNSLPGQLDIEDVDLDEPGPGEIRVRTAACGLCHSDLHVMENLLPMPVPAVLGHEAAGVVESVGPGVTEFAPGDHVIGCLSVFCGACRYCLTGHSYLCEDKTPTRRPRDARPRISRRGEPVGHGMDIAGFAEHMILHQNAAVTIRKDMPLDRAALIGCGVMTGVGAVFNTARLQAGETVAVIGCGGIGLNIVQGAALAGASRVIAIDLQPSKLKLAEVFGATDVIDASKPDAFKTVLAMTGGGVDAAFEAIGLKATNEQAFKMVRPGGTAYMVGVMPAGQNVEYHGLELLSRSKGIKGVYMGSNNFKVDMPRLVDLYLQGRLKLDELISARITLDEVNEGYRVMKGGEVARSVIVF